MACWALLERVEQEGMREVAQNDDGKTEEKNEDEEIE